MAARLTPAEREQKRTQAWALSLGGRSAPAIARQLGITEKTVDRLLAEVRDEVRATNGQDRHALLARAIAEQEAIFADAWRRISAAPGPLPEVAAFQRNALAASMNMSRLRGLLIERHEHTGADGGPVRLAHDLSGLTDEELNALERIVTRIERNSGGAEQA